MSYLLREARSSVTSSANLSELRTCYVFPLVHPLLNRCTAASHFFRLKADNTLAACDVLHNFYLRTDVSHELLKLIPQYAVF